MPTYAELMEILKANEIRGYSHYTKSKLIDFLIKRGLIPEKYDTNKQVKARNDIDPKYYFLKQIHSNQKTVEIHDLETDKVVLPNTRLLSPWIKIPEQLLCIMEKYGGTGML